MNPSKYRCLQCQQSHWLTGAASWRCESCGQIYPCINGIPKFYLEQDVDPHDRALRDRLYDGFMGAYYPFVWPLISLPARPFRISWHYWIVYFVLATLLVLLIVHVSALFLSRHLDTLTNLDVIFVGISIGLAAFLYGNPYLLYLLALAIPTKLSLLFANFKPKESFSDVHTKLIKEFKSTGRTLRVLDVSTGSCDSLYRHGWVELNADFTGIDLSQTMMERGAKFMIENKILMDFALADALNLPFHPETFDIVLNYGAINSMSDPAQALREMARVAKSGALVLFLDEQLYEAASFIEKLYFETVLSRHNVIHQCPVDLLPPNLEGIKVHQVYQFYYICTATKV